MAQRGFSIGLIYLFWLALIPGAAGGQGSAIIEGWQTELAEIDELLVKGEDRKAWKRASAFFEGAAKRPVEGESVEATLARGLLLKAVAAHRLGDEHAALFLWDSARAVYPQIEQFDLAPYGEAGRLFSTRPAPSRPTSPSEIYDPAWDGKDLVKPKQVRGRQPNYPVGARGVGAGGRIVVDVVVDLEGRPHGPMVLHVEGLPVFVATLLDAMSTWRYRPGTVDGEVVEMRTRSVVSYSLR